MTAACPVAEFGGDDGEQHAVGGCVVQVVDTVRFGQVIEDSDTIIALPTRMCRYAEAHFAVKSLPINSSDRFTYVAIWHHRQHQRPLLRWILDNLAV